MAAQVLLLELNAGYRAIMTMPKRSIRAISKAETTPRAEGCVEVGRRLILKRITSQLSLARLLEDSMPRMPMRNAPERVAAAMAPSRKRRRGDRTD